MSSKSSYSDAACLRRFSGSDFQEALCRRVSEFLTRKREGFPKLESLMLPVVSSIIQHHNSQACDGVVLHDCQSDARHDREVGDRLVEHAYNPHKFQGNFKLFKPQLTVRPFAFRQLHVRWIQEAKITAFG